jgi:hypothetical protein
VKRYAFSRRTRFRFVYQDGSEAGDFEIARPGPSGDLIATSLDHGAERIFTLAELRQAIAEQRLRFHLEGRHAQPATCGTPSISPREPDFSEPCISCSGTLAVWPSLLISPAVEAAEEAVEPVAGARRRHGARRGLRQPLEVDRHDQGLRLWLRDFLGFCEVRGLSALPASDETIALYLSEMADRGAKAATIARRLVVISQAHKGADLPTPTSSSLVRGVHAGVRRTIGTA